VGGERGQTTVEWTALVLGVAIVLTAVVAVAPRVDGRSFGGFLAHSIVCAARGGCDDGTSELARAYGDDDAELVRSFAPNVVYEPGTYTLPVDFRECRSHDCADAPDDPDLDVQTARRGGARATAFTHVVRRNGRTYLQYWLYYPDSTSTVGNLAGAWNTIARAVTPADGGDPRESYPGYHPDDWESYQVRIDPGGRAFARASSHHGYQGCKRRSCANEWTPLTGWTRVSRGSHAGHIPLRESGGGVALEGGRLRLLPRTYSPSYPGIDVRERTSTAAGLRLIPVEGIAHDASFAVSPPWRKRTYSDPDSNSTG
jgi:hypothetical protein